MARKRRILAVDDERHIVRLIQVNLERAGYEVATAFDGPEALKSVEAEKPDLCVLDVMMPKMDGFEVLKRLQANPETRDIPVIMLTAKAQDAITPGLICGNSTSQNARHAVAPQARAASVC